MGGRGEGRGRSLPMLKAKTSPNINTCVLFLSFFAYRRIFSRFISPSFAGSLSR